MLRLSRPLASLITVIGIAVAVTFTAIALFEAADNLPGGIASALMPDPRTAGSPDSEQLNLVIVCGPLTDVARGMQLAFFVLVLGNVPAAILASVLVARRSNRSRFCATAWADVFFCGFIFQAGGLLFTGTLFLTLLAVASDSARVLWESLPLGGILLASLVCSLCGMRSWRVLETEACESITARRDEELVALERCWPPTS